MAPRIRIFCPEEIPIQIVKWKVKKGSMVLKGSILGLYKSSQSNSDVKLKSPETGIVDRIFIEAGGECQPGSLLVTLRQPDSGGCTHPTVMKDMCADCGADLRNEYGVAGDRKEKVTASVAMVHNIPELIISQEQALELGHEDEQRLLKTRKLVLLVDLDQTLIHTTNDNIPPRLKDVHHFQLWQQGPHSSWYHTRLRPHTLTFLERVSKLYELHICTFGVRLYAHTVARLMDPDEKFFSHRILSRDECFDPQSKTANLKALFPCGDGMVCIIDDREDVWNHAPNLVHVKPYRFFQGTADINAPPGLEKCENDDVPIVHKVVDHHDTSDGQPAESQPKSGEDGQKSEGGVSDQKSEGENSSQKAEDKISNQKTDGEVSNQKTASEISSQKTKGEISNQKTEGKISSQKTEGEVSSQKNESEVSSQKNEGENSNQKTDGEISSQKNEGGVSPSADSGKDGGDAQQEAMEAGDQTADSPTEEKTAGEPESLSADRNEEETQNDKNDTPAVAESGDSAQVAEDENGAEKNIEESDSVREPQPMETSVQDELAQDLCLSSDSDSPSADFSDSASSGTKLANGGSTTTVNNASPSNTNTTPDKTDPSVDATTSDKTDDGKTAVERTDSSESSTKQNEKDPSDSSTPSEETKSKEAKTSDSSEESKAASQKAEEEEEEEVEWDDEDDYLLHLEEILTRIHKAFYTMVDEKRQPSPTQTSLEGCPRKKNGLPDLKSIIPYVKRKTLKGCNIVFSGMVPLNTPPEKSQAYIVAKGLGATVQPDIVGPKEAKKKDQVTTHLVAAKPGTSKHKSAMRVPNLHIVHSPWLWACNERWERCDERLFPLTADHQSSASSGSQKPDKREPQRHRKRKVMPSTEQGESDSSSNASKGKRHRKSREGKEERSKKGASGMSGEGTLRTGEKRSPSFADTVPPLMAFSDEDLECMDKEVDELMAEDGTGSEDETDQERDERYRVSVLGSVTEASSSSDSLSGDLPRGWGLRRKLSSSPHGSDDDLEKRKLEVIELETEDTECEMVRFQTTVETFSPDSDSSKSSFAESIGSVDDELAEAVEKEFLGSL